ncbi:MAG: hypothetical protein HQM15_10155 [Deltaproteobacteria bacterium]|nr:hypothetical protein [Deltaproteobacteria bacterium]
MTPQGIAQIDNSKRVMVMLACLAEHENAFELFHFGSEALEASLIDFTREILSLPKNDRQKFILREFRKFKEQEKLRPVEELHMGWLQEALKQENPFVVIHLIRPLGHSKVKQILQAMPEDFLKKLRIFDSKAQLDPALVEILQKRFYSQFYYEKPSKNFEEQPLAILYYLKLDFLKSFLSQIGLERLALAFKGLHKSALKALFNRLPLKDAKTLQRQVKSIQKISPREISESQSLLLNLALETIEPENLFFEVGLAYITKAFIPEDANLSKAIQLRLPPKMAYLLKRYLEQNRVREASTVRQRILRFIQEKIADLPSHAFY